MLMPRRPVVGVWNKFRGADDGGLDEAPVQFRAVFAERTVMYAWHGFGADGVLPDLPAEFAWEPGEVVELV